MHSRNVYLNVKIQYKETVHRKTTKICIVTSNYKFKQFILIFKKLLKSSKNLNMENKKKIRDFIKFINFFFLFKDEFMCKINSFNIDK